MRPAALPLVLLAAVMPFVDALRAQPAKGEKYAVLIGVNEYTKPRFEALRFAEKDMRDLKAALEEAGSPSPCCSDPRPGTPRRRPRTSARYCWTRTGC